MELFGILSTGVEPESEELVALVDVLPELLAGPLAHLVVGKHVVTGWDRDVEPDPAHIAVGMAVEVTFDDVTDEITLPKFRPRP